MYRWLLFNFLPPCRAPRSSWWTLHLAMCSQLRGAPERGSQGAAGKMVRGNNHGLHGSYMEKNICVYMCGKLWKYLKIMLVYIYIYTYEPNYIWNIPIVHGLYMGSEPLHSQACCEICHGHQPSIISGVHQNIGIYILNIYIYSML